MAQDKYRLKKDVSSPTATLKAGIVGEDDGFGRVWFGGTFWNKFHVESDKEWFEPLVKEESKDWEIVELKGKDSGNVYKKAKGMWLDKNQNGFPVDKKDPQDTGCDITSVKRLSDNEVFSIGDEITYKPVAKYSLKIWKFQISSTNEKDMLVLGENGNCEIVDNNLEKRHVPLPEKYLIKENKEQFVWTDVRVQQFCHNWWGQKDSFEEEVAAFKQSKQPPIAPKTERIEVFGINILMTEGNGKDCHFYTNGDVPKEKLPLIQQAIEKVLNDDKP